MTLPTGRTGPHVFVEDLDTLVLEAHDAHHVRRVLRVRPNDEITVGDGAGRWLQCRLGTDDVLLPDGEVVSCAEPAPPLTIAFALVKGSKPELAVQKLTELGIDRIVVFPAARSVAQWDTEKVERNVPRLVRVAREASMQSRRVWLPRVEYAPSLLDVGPLVLAEREGSAPTSDLVSVAIGPEGGWTDDERSHFGHVELGSQVLRAETAAIAAGALLGALRAGVVSPAHGS